MRSVLCVLLWYCFTIDLYKLRKYIRLVVLDRETFHADGVTLTEFRMKVIKDSSVWA